MNNPYIFWFPYEKVPREASVVIYGAGHTGDDYIRQIQQEGYCNILYVADENYKEIKSIYGVDVCAPDRLAAFDEYDYVVIASLWFAYEMKTNLERLGVPKEKVICTFQYGLKPYTACGEDLIVYTILKFLGKEKFSYIDLGANEPFNVNNTAYLYIHGGRGILVEPNPDLIPALKDNRSEDIVLNVGVSTESGTLEYYMFEDDKYNTFSLRFVEGSKRKGHKLIKTIQVPVMTLTEIINTYADGIYPDFLSIDIEDMDYDVLCSCDFTKSSPTVICVEVSNNNCEEMDEMLDAKGFVPFHRARSNVIYLRKDICK